MSPRLHELACTCGVVLRGRNLKVEPCLPLHAKLHYERHFLEVVRSIP